MKMIEPPGIYNVIICVILLLKILFMWIEEETFALVLSSFGVWGVIGNYCGILMTMTEAFLGWLLTKPGALQMQ